MPGWSNTPVCRKCSKTERFCAFWRDRENGDEAGYSRVSKKKIIMQTAKTHSHTKAEQMSGVQCGLNEP